MPRRGGTYQVVTQAIADVIPDGGHFHAIAVCAIDGLDGIAIGYRDVVGVRVGHNLIPYSSGQGRIVIPVESQESTAMALFDATSFAGALRFA